MHVHESFQSHSHILMHEKNVIDWFMASFMLFGDESYSCSAMNFIGKNFNDIH